MLAAVVASSSCGDDAVLAPHLPPVAETPGDPEPEGPVVLEAASIRIVANSFIGVRYVESVHIARISDGYWFDLLCRGSCSCFFYSNVFTLSQIQPFVATAATLPDDGPNPIADGPWIEVLTVFSDGTGRDRIVSGLPLGISLRELFGVKCGVFA